MSESNSILVAYRKRFLLSDLLVSVAVTATAILLSQVPVWPVSLDPTSEARRALYTTVAAITGSLLGFIIAAITIALALPQTPGTKLLRKSRYYKDVYATFLSTLRYLGFTTIVAVVPLIVAMEGTAEAIHGILFVWLVTLSVFRVARSVWVLSQLVAVVTSTPGERGCNPQPPPDSPPTAYE
jgi:hypothetical protein